MVRHHDELAGAPASVGAGEAADEFLLNQRVIHRVDEKRGAAGHTAQGGEDGAEHADAPAAIYDDACAARHVGANLAGAVAENDDGAGQAATILDGDFERGMTAKTGESFGKAQPAGVARGEDDRHDFQAASSVLVDIVEARGAAIFRL